VRQLTIPECSQTALSPSGAYLGCIDEALGLKLVDVETNTVLVNKKQFYVFTDFFSCTVIISHARSVSLSAFSI